MHVSALSATFCRSISRNLHSPTIRARQALPDSRPGCLGSDLPGQGYFADFAGQRDTKTESRNSSFADTHTHTARLPQACSNEGLRGLRNLILVVAACTASQPENFERRRPSK